MSVVIPWTRIASLALRPVLFSGNQEGSLGGPDLAVPRLGDRFAADLSTTQLQQDAAGRQLIALLTQALTDDAQIALLQPNVPALSLAGAGVVIDGAGQAGTALAVRGGNSGATLRQGQWISLIHAGLHYVHMLTADVTFGSNGKATLGLWPMLRFLTTDGDAVMVDNPVIEGRVVGFDKGAAFRRNRVDPIEFSIVERR